MRRWPRSPRGAHGFTLVELLVVTAIFLAIVGYLLANFRSTRAGDAVRTSAAGLAARIDRLATNALAGTADAGALAYGIHIDRAAPDRYVLFADRATADRPANGRYDPGEALTDGTTTLADVTISALAPADAVDLTFAVPRGIVVLHPDAREARITLRATRGIAERTVVVNRISGLITVE